MSRAEKRKMLCPFCSHTEVCEDMDMWVHISMDHPDDYSNFQGYVDPSTLFESPDWVSRMQKRAEAAKKAAKEKHS